ncbi:MAG: TatD family hydrolase [Alphaproteobacteria bacterium]|nr:TatD family hydrolase [Alphaproteobacteria bacterium]
MIDAHIHLQDHRFDADREKLIRQAQQCGVEGFLCASAAPSDWQPVCDLAGRHANIRPFIGTHPWHAPQHDAALLRKLLTEHPHAGVGEIGLDAFKTNPAQESAFIDQLIIAAELKRPCVIHCVKSFDQMAAFLKRLKDLPPALMFHGYSGTIRQAEFLLHFNAYFSFSGSVLSAHKRKLQAVLAALPEDRILAETDAPDMKPAPNYCFSETEKRNIPANLPFIIQGIAAIRKTDANSLKAVLRHNIERFCSSLKS